MKAGKVQPAADYEAYSVEHPHLHAADAYPKALLPALTGRAGTFVDVGAGTGGPLRALVHGGHLRSFSTIVATDIAQVHVDMIRATLPAVQALHADALRLPFADESVDFYFSDQVIEHVPSDVQMAAEAFRVLKPGGIAFIGSVRKTPWAWYYYRCNGRWALDPTHVREYESSDTYRALFEHAGFTGCTLASEPVAFPLHSVALVGLARLHILPPAQALRLSALPSVQQFGRLHIPVPGYSYIYATSSKPQA